MLNLLSFGKDEEFLASFNLCENHMIVVVVVIVDCRHSYLYIYAYTLSQCALYDNPCYIY